MKKPIVAIVGRPNAGKSTLFNRIIGKKHAIISPIQGTTRDRLYQDTSWNGRSFTLMDMGGIDALDRTGAAELTALLKGIQEQVQMALQEADVIIYLIDAHAHVTQLDTQIVKQLRKFSKPLLLVANKADANMPMPDQAYKLGLGDPYLISALHGYGVADLLDDLVKQLPSKGSRTLAEPKKNIAVAIVGKPNVGKSSFLNAVLGETKVLVSPIPGTTRDTTDTDLIYKDAHITLIDTAGLRRPSKVARDTIEHYSVLRAKKALERADIAVLMLDVGEDIAHQDESIASIIQESKKGLVFVVNKWDLVEKDTKTMSKYAQYLHRVFDYLSWAPVVFTSAVTGERVTNVLDTVLQIAAEREKRIDQNALTTLIQKIQAQHPPGYSPGSGMIKLSGAEQIDVNPPVIMITTNAPSSIRFEYRRFLERKVREAFGFAGTYIQIVMRKKEGRR